MKVGYKLGNQDTTWVVVSSEEEAYGRVKRALEVGEHKFGYVMFDDIQYCVTVEDGKLVKTYDSGTGLETYEKIMEDISEFINLVKSLVYVWKDSERVHIDYLPDDGEFLILEDSNKLISNLYSRGDDDVDFKFCEDCYKRVLSGFSELLELKVSKFYIEPDCEIFGFECRVVEGSGEAEVHVY